MAVRDMQHNLDEALAMSPRRKPPSRWVVRHPVLFGMFLSLLVAGAAMVVATWLPGVGAVAGKHSALLESVYYTGGFWGAYLYYFWPLRRVPSFWPTLGGLFLLHAVGVYSYTVQVHPLVPWQWVLLGFLEGMVLVLRWGASWPPEHGRAG